MERKPLQIEVVAAERLVWEGEAVNVIARTTEGDIGVLPGHAPLLAQLVPCAVTIVTSDGRSEDLAIDGGFISVAQGRVSIMSQSVVLAHEITLEEAYREAASLREQREAGSLSDEGLHHLNILNAQIAVAEKLA